MFEDEILTVEVMRLPWQEGLTLPSYHSPGAAGMDLVAALTAPRSLIPSGLELIPTGIKIAIPAGWEGQIRPRSGLAVNHYITLPNAPATIDSDYRGELMVPLINLGDSTFVVERGMRIAQIIFGRVATVRWHEVADLPPTERGHSGFGHTGLK